MAEQEDRVVIYIWNKLNKKKKLGVFAYTITWGKSSKSYRAVRPVRTKALLDIMSLNEALNTYAKTTIASINKNPITVYSNGKLARKVSRETVKIPEHMDKNIRPTLENFNIQVYTFTPETRSYQKKLQAMCTEVVPDGVNK